VYGRSGRLTAGNGVVSVPYRDLLRRRKEEHNIADVIEYQEIYQLGKVTADTSSF
jgi:hypothetical protein